MGARRFLGWSGALLTLVLGGLGCEDRLRPTFSGSILGDGPTGEFLAPTPAELDTVLFGGHFPLDIRMKDPDGVDSVWVDLEPEFESGLHVGGGGDTSVTVGWNIYLPDSLVPPAETLKIHLWGLDSHGDTGVVLTRRLILH